ncbi:hypothetical protein [Pseudaeromonas paramecii]|uniref:Uncharacterized protein n=1 Tax=Pseudaeromonas paramecii TaxID=2138166 RepID=A0ABP8PY60_9GAMM
MTTSIRSYKNPNRKKLDGPRLRANASAMALFEQAAFATGQRASEFLAEAVLSHAKTVLIRMYQTQPRAFERVLERATEAVRRQGLQVDRITFGQLLDDLELDDMPAMAAALERCGITINLERSDWKEIA